MKGFLLDSGGDVVITGRKIQMIEDNELKRQTVERVISTNRGEWFLNDEEGINFKGILTKNPNMDEVRSEIQQGLLYVDSTLFIQSFDYKIVGRELQITFVASNGTDTVTGGATYAE